MTHGGDGLVCGCGFCVLLPSGFVLFLLGLFVGGCVVVFLLSVLVAVALGAVAFLFAVLLPLVCVLLPRPAKLF